MENQKLQLSANESDYQRWLAKQPKDAKEKSRIVVTAGYRHQQVQAVEVKSDENTAWLLDY